MSFLGESKEFFELDIKVTLIYRYAKLDRHLSNQKLKCHLDYYLYYKIIL